jgi:hypothetical protein
MLPGEWGERGLVKLIGLEIPKPEFFPRYLPEKHLISEPPKRSIWDGSVPNHGNSATRV